MRSIPLAISLLTLLPAPAHAAYLFGSHLSLENVNGFVVAEFADAFADGQVKSLNLSDFDAINYDVYLAYGQQGYYGTGQVSLKKGDFEYFSADVRGYPGKWAGDEPGGWADAQNVKIVSRLFNWTLGGNGYRDRFIPTRLIVENGMASYVDANGRTYATARFSAYVPEPASWAMMIAGFGLVGFGLRRSKHSGQRYLPTI